MGHTEANGRGVYSMCSTVRGRILDHGIFLALFLIVFACSLETASASMEDKRAGFVGMRGKKDQEDNEALFYAPLIEDAASKRAGFVGMRGKKGKNYWPSYWFSTPNLDRESRGNSGFVGMRGRK